MITTLYVITAVLWLAVAYSIRHEIEQTRRIERLEGRYAELDEAIRSLRLLVYGNRNKS